jgi:hypothetical protein
MKIGPDARYSAKNESGTGKLENRDPMPSVLSKTSLGTQNMKTGSHAPGKAENEFGHAKHENGTRRLRYRRKRVRECKIRKWDPTSAVPPKMSLGAQNKKTGPDAPGTAKNESESAKQENTTRRPWYRRKLVKECKK